MSSTSLRYELKLVTAAHLLPQLRAAMRQHSEGFRSQHRSRQVNSLYFDTPSLASYRANLLGDTRRHKLRLRWYGAERDQVDAQLELKRKRNMLGDKQLWPLAERIDLRQSWSALRRALLAQTPPTWHVQLDEATEAVSITQYWREYYVSADQQIRVTFDSQQRFFDQRGHFRPNLRYASRAPAQIVIELKADPELSERLENLAGLLPVRRSRNSKYVNSLNAANH